MSLLVWLPLTDNTENQGLLSLPTPWESRSRETGGKIGQYCYTDRAIYHLISEPLNNQWSIACWVKSTSWSANNDIIICKNSSESTNCQFYFSIINGASLNLGINGGAGNGAGSQAYTFSINTWYHVAATYDGSNYAMYVNGEKIKSGTYSSTMPTGLLNLCIGCRSTSAAGTSSTGNANKRLNDVRIYDECLSPLEVKRISQALVLHYPLNDRYIESTTNLITTEDGLSSTCYNGATSKYSYGTNTDMYKTVCDFNGKHGTKVYMGTDGASCFPYVYVNNLYVSDGTNQPEYKTLSFDYYGTVGGYLGPYKLGSGSGTATYNVTCKGNTTTGSYTNSGFLPVTINEWNHVEITLHGTTEANAEWGYIRIGNSSHTSDTSNYWLFANMQLEVKDHATPYAGVGATRTAETTIYETSGYCRNSTITAGTLSVLSDTPRYSASTYFDGTSVISSTTQRFGIVGDCAFTMSAWVYWDKDSWNNDYVGVFWNNKQSQDQAMAFCLYNGRPDLDIWNHRYIATNAISVKTWHHIAAVKIPGTLDSTAKLYVDGVEVAGTGTGGVSPNIVENGIVIGRLNASTTRFFTGKISDVRVYATALSADDVKALYEDSAYIATDGTAYAYEFVEE